MYRATAVEKSPDWQAAFEALTFSTNSARDAAPRDAEPVGSTCKKLYNFKIFIIGVKFDIKVTFHYYHL